MSRRLPESSGEHSRGKAAEAAAVLKQRQSDEAAEAAAEWLKQLKRAR